MSNSEVLLGEIMETIETEGLLNVSEIKSIRKLILSKKIKEEDWITALENTHFSKEANDDLED